MCLSPLSEWAPRCPVCGFTTDRDYKASMNILKSGRGSVFTEKTPMLQPVKGVVSGFDEVRSITALKMYDDAIHRTIYHYTI